MTHTNENKTNIEEPFPQLDMKFADTEAGNRDRFVALNKGKCICSSVLSQPSHRRYIIVNKVQILQITGAVIRHRPVLWCT